MTYEPMYDPKQDASTWTAPVSLALDNAREILADKQGANINDHSEMIRAAVGLEMRLRQLVAAIDAERASGGSGSADRTAS